METIKLLKKGMGCFMFAVIAFCGACTNNLSNTREDLHKVTKLLEPINVLDDSFRLERASKDEDGNKENRYSLSQPSSIEKYVFIVEFNVNNTIDRQKLADVYATYLRDGGEEVVLRDLKDKKLSILYSISREEDKTYLSVSKFQNKDVQKVLKNEYLLQLSEQQNNEKYIQQIVNDFIETDMIDIRPVIIEKQGNITDVRSY